MRPVPPSRNDDFVVPRTCEMTTQTLVFLTLFVGILVLKWKMGRKSVEDLDAIRTALADGAQLVDVRSNSEFAGGHLAGALSIPVGSIAQRAKELGDPSRPVVLYCASGARSAAARRTLIARGFSEVLDLGPMTNARSLGDGLKGA